MSKLSLSFLTLLFFLTSCVPQSPSQAPTPLAPPTEQAPAAATTANEPEESVRPLRYAITAPTSAANIWRLFGATASYEDYLLLSQNHPRLYTLQPQEEALIPRLAAEFPAPFQQEGAFFTATLTLRPDQHWDDGSPLTATDIAFTLNTALEFQLGATQQNAFLPAKLDHIEALDAQTLKYYFTAAPNAGEWQYGVLVGFFASQAYWEEKIAAAKSLLPQNNPEASIAKYQNELNALQNEEKNITAYMSTLKEKSANYREQERLLAQNLTEQETTLARIETLRKESEESYTAARNALYALDTHNEPLLAAAHPVIETLPRTDALQALLNNRIDLILSPQSLTAAEIAELSTDPDIRFLESRRNDIRYLAFNHRKNPLDDIALRRALSCLIDPAALTADLAEGKVVPAFGWIPPENSGWHTGIIEPPCSGLDADARLAAGMRTLQTAGYAWEQEPGTNQVGRGLTLPSGAEFPALTLLAPSEDASRAAAASLIAAAAQKLGIPLSAEIVPSDELFFRVYGIRDYDMALLGWQLSLYPDYLCRFFTADNPYHYQNAALDEKCDEFLSTENLSQERELLFQIEILLWDDLPALPLFSTKLTEAYRNLSLSQETYWGGIAASPYGAFDILTKP